jgi:hypothetical protein
MWWRSRLGWKEEAHLTSDDVCTAEPASVQQE